MISMSSWWAEKHKCVVRASGLLHRLAIGDENLGSIKMELHRLDSFSITGKLAAATD